MSYLWTSLWTVGANTQINWTASFKSSPRGIPLFEVVRPYKALDLLSAASSRSAVLTQLPHSEQPGWRVVQFSQMAVGMTRSKQVASCLMQQIKFAKQSHSLSLFCSWSLVSPKLLRSAEINLSDVQGSKQTSIFDRFLLIVSLSIHWQQCGRGLKSWAHRSTRGLKQEQLDLAAQQNCCFGCLSNSFQLTCKLFCWHREHTVKHFTFVLPKHSLERFLSGTFIATFVEAQGSQSVGKRRV